MSARISGIVLQMSKFRCYYGLKLAHFVLRHTDNLATKLQNSELNAAQGFEFAMMMAATLEAQKNFESFENFYINVRTTAEDNDVEDAVLPRQRKVPAKSSNR